MTLTPELYQRFVDLIYKKQVFGLKRINVILSINAWMSVLQNWGWKITGSIISF